MSDSRLNTKGSTNVLPESCRLAWCTNYSPSPHRHATSSWHPCIWRAAAVIGLLLLCCGRLASAADPGEIAFARDVLPILSQNCFACHGPDAEQRAADLRLDDREAAISAEAIVPGKPDDSAMIQRIESADPDERMPPAEAKKVLTDAQREVLRRWIASGGKYEQHWAFVAPTLPPEPNVRDASWVRNPIDRFVLQRIEQNDIRPSPPADPYTLVRRVYLDLIGLPPTPEQADAFVQDTRPEAYELLVDQLLQSPHYGERWARWWLDVARYADTNGYEKDRPRSIWPYRDWVINALNADMPFDQFTIEQLAGDMLPNATESQRIATGFHRNTMLNEEGGIDPLEFRYYAMADRIATTGLVWLGLTTGCAQCHSHKYDPISHREYFQLLALLNNADEPDLIVHDPQVAANRATIESQIAIRTNQLADRFPLPTPADGASPKDPDRDVVEDEATRRAKHLDQQLRTWVDEQQKRAVAWTTLARGQLSSNLPKLEFLDDGSILSTGDITKRDVYTLDFELADLKMSPQFSTDQPITALRLEALPDDRLPARGPGRCYYEGRKGDFFLSEVVATCNGNKVEIASASHTYGKNGLGSGSAEASNVLDSEGSTGWSTAEREGQRHQLMVVLRDPLPAQGTLRIEMIFERHYAASLGRFRWSATSAPNMLDPSRALQDLPLGLETQLQHTPADWTAEQWMVARQYYLMTCPELAAARQEVQQLRSQLPEWPVTMIMSERSDDNVRPTYRHHRGEYVSPRELVEPAVPAIFPQLPTDQPADRLEFARWLVSDRNPLVGRVTVNRIWRTYFGEGLVRSNGDFGTQSEPPTHPELLDWLAETFRRGGWSMKSLHRLIVTSATYRQSSHIAEGIADHENRLLARAGRYRLDAEIVRDQTLAVSGRLSRRVGGPSVFPPQPDSVTSLAYGGFQWSPSGGDDRYRRSLYTFAKRTTPFAASTVFDGPTGENCVAQRDRSNTPLQALTLLNDPMFTELAVAFAERTINEAATSDACTDDASRDIWIATRLFRQVAIRPPRDNELQALTIFAQRQRNRLSAKELDPSTVCGRTDASPELAVWTLTARVLFNLDEVVTHE